MFKSIAIFYVSLRLINRLFMNNQISHVIVLDWLQIKKLLQAFINSVKTNYHCKLTCLHLIDLIYLSLSAVRVEVIISRIYTCRRRNKHFPLIKNFLLFFLQKYFSGKK